MDRRRHLRIPLPLFLRQYRSFPDLVLAAGEFLLVWCDSDPEDGPRTPASSSAVVVKRSVCSAAWLREMR